MPGSGYGFLYDFHAVFDILELAIAVTDSCVRHLRNVYRFPGHRDTLLDMPGCGYGSLDHLRTAPDSFWEFHKNSIPEPDRFCKFYNTLKPVLDRSVRSVRNRTPYQNACTLQKTFVISLPSSTLLGII